MYDGRVFQSPPAAERSSRALTPPSRPDLNRPNRPRAGRRMAESTADEPAITCPTTYRRRSHDRLTKS
jgi:hypothetical protein